VAVRVLVRGVSVGVVTAGAVLAGAGVAAAVPVADYQLPFSCTQSWTGSTRSYHSPSSKAVDFNRHADRGKVVLAAERGVVTTATNLGNRSYGKYIRVNHGNNESTLYAHLDAMYVSAGQRVDQGQVIGTVGASGGTTGPHLHFEQRKGSSVVTPYFDKVAYRMPQTSASRNCVHVPVAGDWNNDRKADPAFFERRWNGFFTQKVGTSTKRFRLGRGLDSPLVGDWDGDGRTDIGVRRALDGVFVLRRSNGTLDRSIRLGSRGDIGIAGDWDGNGTTEVGIWRPRSADFQIRWSNGTVRTFKAGSARSLPVTGDFNGDRRTDLGLFDQDTATWTLYVTNGTGWRWHATVTAGKPGEIPVTGDWNGDRITDLATWNRATGVWTMTHEKDGAVRTTTTRFGARP
jgi:hypothetical protein